MRYCIIGSGGREHAIAWRLMTDGSAREVYVLPGNGGIADEFRVNMKIDDFGGITKFCYKKKIDMVVVGPEVPLSAGITDYLVERGIRTFGPSKRAAMLEGSKLFAKKIMRAYGVPTGDYREFDSRDGLLRYIDSVQTFPMVIKLDGLAAGKGVGIPESREDARAFVDSMVRDGMKVFVEEYIEGEEASVLGICDGETVLPLVAAQDHKRVFDGDRGPNTGGMGAYAPAPVMTADRLERVRREVLVPTVEGMKKEGIPFKGILYAGVIVNGDDLRVLEFNARFGDPETQVILPLLENRLGDLFTAAEDGTLAKCDIRFARKSAITVVMASGGYPGDYEKGKAIKGLDAVPEGALVFHAGTEKRDGSCHTAGGRVLNVTATGTDLSAARDLAYEAVGRISFEGAFFRRDIGYRALK
ncbi:MAG TPA: phosphoribosylamine--glycine ligase [Spirochaetota bacterium]|nr:phosphoribosylamine--glycine ligase [Spirochaetota bacterium]